MDLNQCVFIGRLVSDPKIEENPDPKETRCIFTLAVNRPFKKGKADFPRFAVWGEKKAHAIMEFCKKGKEITVVARYQTEWYPPEKEGGKGVNFQIFRADQVIFGPDSQKVLREKGAARKVEMNKTITILHEGEVDQNMRMYPAGTVEKILNQWAKERYER